MRAAARISWMLTAAGALFGAAEFFFAWLSAQSGAASAPQYAAAASGAMAMVVIPYCLARAMDELARGGVQKSSEP